MISSNDINKIFGHNLKVFRKSKGLTQEKLAELLGMQFQSISFIETGRAFVSSEVYAKICNFFNIPPAMMFKPNFIEQTENTKNVIKEINQILLDCDKETVTKFRNMLVALKN